MAPVSEQDPYISVSNTEIQTFLECRRKWWLAYVRKLRLAQTSVVGPLPLGSRLHKALERYYKSGADPLVEHAALLAQAEAAALEAGDDMVALASEGELGRLMLEGFLQWSAEDGIDSGYEIVGVEELLSARMLGGMAEVKGKLDLRIRDKRDGSHLLRDWKSAAQPSSYTKWAHMNPQLMTYMVLDYLNTPESLRIAGGQFLMLKKVKRGPRAKPPFYEAVEVRHNVFTLRSFWTRLQGVLTEMVAVKQALDGGADHRFVAYPTPSRECSWRCPFFTVCPLIDDGSGAEDMIAASFVEVEPYDYYDDDKEND